MQGIKLDAAGINALAEGCAERFKAWKGHEAGERKALWYGRFLLVAPVLGAVLGFLFFTGSGAGPWSAVMVAGVTYVQALAFLSQFIRTERRWISYLAAGDAIRDEARELERLVSVICRNRGGD